MCTILPLTRVQRTPHPRLAHARDPLPTIYLRTTQPGCPVVRTHLVVRHGHNVHSFHRRACRQPATRKWSRQSLQQSQACASSFKSCCTASTFSQHQHDTLHASVGSQTDHHGHHEHEHGAPITNSRVHQILEWLFSRLGLLQLAAYLRDKTWNAILISALMFIALMCSWLGGYSTFHQQAVQRLSSAATAAIYAFGGIHELVDLCFDITAGHIDTHVLMTLAVFGTLAIGGALEVPNTAVLSLLMRL